MKPLLSCALSNIGPDLIQQAVKRYNSNQLLCNDHFEQIEGLALASTVFGHAPLHFGDFVICFGRFCDLFCYVPQSSIEVKVVDSLQSIIFLHIYPNHPRKFPVDDVLYSIFILSEISI